MDAFAKLSSLDGLCHCDLWECPLSVRILSNCTEELESHCSIENLTRGGFYDLTLSDMIREKFVNYSRFFLCFQTEHQIKCKKKIIFFVNKTWITNYSLKSAKLFFIHFFLGFFFCFLMVLNYFQITNFWSRPITLKLFICHYEF